MITDFHAKYLARELAKRSVAEADKVNCGKKHYEAIGVPFDVVVEAKDV